MTIFLWKFTALSFVQFICDVSVCVISIQHIFHPFVSIFIEYSIYALCPFFIIDDGLLISSFATKQRPNEKEKRTPLFLFNVCFAFPFCVTKNLCPVYEFYGSIIVFYIMHAQVETKWIIFHIFEHFECWLFPFLLLSYNTFTSPADLSTNYSCCCYHRENRCRCALHFTPSKHKNCTQYLR